MEDATSLAHLLQPYLAGDPGRLRLTPVATGRHNRSFWVDGGPERLLLRIAPPDDTGLLFFERRMMRQEPTLHSLIQARTTIPVAAIVGADFSRAQIDRDYLLMQVLPGAPLGTVALTAGALPLALHQLGAHLRTLHTLTAPDCLGISAYGYLGEHQPMAPQPTWADAFAVMWHRLLDDVVACGSYTSDEADALRDLFAHYRPHFERPVTASLLHMDVWSENILVNASGEVTGLVDFDRALWGDVEIEFAVLDYCGISEPAFWAGYGQARDQSPSALIRRQFYLLYEVQKYMPISVWRRHDPQRAARYYQASRDLVAPLWVRRSAG